MASKTLEYVFTAKDQSVLSSMKQQGATADQLKAKYQELQKAGQQANKKEENTNVLGDLKKQLGARSNLGQLAKLAVGRGAIAGLTGLALALSEAATKAKDLKTQFDAGQISAGAFANGLIEGIPIIGQFWEAGQKVRDLLASFAAARNSGVGKLIGLDELHDAEEINKTEAARKIILDNQAESIERQTKAIREQRNAIRAIQNEAGKQGREGDNAAEYDRQVEQGNKLAAIEDKRAEALEAAEKQRKAAADKLQADKTLSPEIKFNAEQALQKQFNSDKAKINQDAAEQARLQNAANADEEYVAYLKHQRQMAQLSADSQHELKDIQTSAQIDRLRALGQDLDAEYLMIEKNAQDKKDAIQKALVEQSRGASQADIDTFRKQANDKHDAVDAEAQGQRQAVVYKALQDAQLKVLQQQADAGKYLAGAELKRVESTRANTEESNRLLAVEFDMTASVEQRVAAQNALAALKAAAAGDDTKSIDDEHLEALQTEAEAGNAAAAAELKRLETSRKLNEEQAKLTAMIQDQNTSVQNRARAEAQLKENAQAQTDLVGKALKDQNTAILQEQAQYGRTANERLNAEKQLTTQKLKDEFAQREAEAQSILQNANATKEQKQQALDNLKAFAEQSGEEYDKQFQKDKKFQKHEFNLEDRGLGGITGVAAGAKAHRDPQEDVVKNTAEGNKLQQQLLQQIQHLVTALTKNPPKPSTNQL